MKIKEEVLVEDKYAWDGFNILKNGHAMFAQDIVKELNCLEKKIDLTQKKIIEEIKKIKEDWLKSLSQYESLKNYIDRKMSILLNQLGEKDD